MGVRTIAYPPSTASKQQLAAISPSASSLNSQSGIVAGSRQHSVRISPTASLLCSRRNAARRTKAAALDRSFIILNGRAELGLQSQSE